MPRTRPPARLKFPNTQLDQASLAPPSNNPTPETADAAATAAGTPFGSLTDGPTTGHDVRPALPVIAPDPVVAVSDLPADLEGNVIVEVTIDAQGNVIRTRVLQALGHGIEEKVLAALRNWHFSPATEDGIAIASQHDVYFHFGRRPATNR
ncbi:MAG TPA: TonB family protein [Terriglobales bacterium]|nr:TonB family protein [Terriglobales bacterium]